VISRYFFRFGLSIPGAGGEDVGGGCRFCRMDAWLDVDANGGVVVSLRRLCSL
jgi:hypothetical protein